MRQFTLPTANQMSRPMTIEMIGYSTLPRMAAKHIRSAIPFVVLASFDVVAPAGASTVLYEDKAEISVQGVDELYQEMQNQKSKGATAVKAVAPLLN